MAESKLGYASGLKIEAGNTAFSGTGTTVTVRTTLVHVIAAIGITVNASTNAGRSVASSPIGAVANGSITFKRTDTTSGDLLHYTLYGW